MKTPFFNGSVTLALVDDTGDLELAIEGGMPLSFLQITADVADPALPHELRINELDPADAFITIGIVTPYDIKTDATSPDNTYRYYQLRLTAKGVAPVTFTVRGNV